MAHSGKFYPVLQASRLMCGGCLWPRYLATQYQLGLTDFVITGGIFLPTSASGARLDCITGDAADLITYAKRFDQGAYGYTYLALSFAWDNTTQLLLPTVSLIYNGLEQIASSLGGYESQDASFFQWNLPGQIFYVPGATCTLPYGTGAAAVPWTAVPPPPKP